MTRESRAPGVSSGKDSHAIAPLTGSVPSGRSPHVVQFDHAWGASLKPSERSAVAEWLRESCWDSARGIRQALIDNVECPPAQRVEHVDDAAFDGLVLLLAEHLTRERSAES